MPGTWTSSMHDEVTIAEIQGLGTSGGLTLGTKKTISCRYEPNGKRTRDADGNVVDRKDKFITHDEVTEGHFVWPPGADTTTTDEALRPSEVNQAPSLDNDERIYEVTL